jgi:hypothetical protein
VLASSALEYRSFYNASTSAQLVKHGDMAIRFELGQTRRLGGAPCAGVSYICEFFIGT